jgi:hypothetical protein
VLLGHLRRGELQTVRRCRCDLRLDGAMLYGTRVHEWRLRRLRPDWPELFAEQSLLLQRNMPERSLRGVTLLRVRRTELQGRARGV